jgi:hypothetical protein
MSEIPPKLMETARKVAREVGSAASYDERSDYPGIEWDEDNAAWDIAQALMAERVRCAKIAGTYKRDASFDDSQVGALEHNSNQQNIARAILGTDIRSPDRDRGEE